MAVPSGDLGDFLVAHWAESLLFLPQMQESPFACQVVLCFHVETFFKVRFPGWIEWVGCSLDGSVPLDFHIDSSSKMDGFRVSCLVLDLSCEYPVVGSFCGEVFLPHPGGTFSWVSSPGPPPQLFEDRTVNGVEGFATGPKSVIARPSSYDRVELDDQVSSRAILQSLDHFPDLFQERFHVLL